jgi:hypothetical protein
MKQHYGVGQFIEGILAEIRGKSLLFLQKWTDAHGFNFSPRQFFGEHHTQKG